MALEDPPPGSAPRYVMPAITSPRKGKRAQTRKPSSERSHSAAQKSVHFMDTRTTKGRKRGLGSTSSTEKEAVSKPSAIGMTTRRTVRSR